MTTYRSNESNKRVSVHQRAMIYRNYSANLYLWEESSSDSKVGINIDAA